MKTISNISRKVTLLIAAFLTSLYTIAQDATGQLDININKNDGGGGAFYEQIWFWVIVGLVFLLLLVALLRNNSSK